MDRPSIQQQLVMHTALVVRLYDFVRRGLVPACKLHTMVDRRVLDATGPAAPPPPGVAVGPARIAGVRVQRTGERHAHAAAVAHDPTGHAVGYVLELRRDGAARPWVVTELTRVEERQLVGPDPDDVTDRRTRGLPQNLTGLIRATEHARDQAAEQLRRAEDQLAVLDATPRNTPRQRQQAAGATARARHDVTVWRNRVADIDTELGELADVAALRKIRAAVLAGDPLMSPRLGQLETLLGPPPDSRDARVRWQRTAGRLLDYAAAWNTTNLVVDVCSKGAGDRNLDQSEDRQVMRDLVEAYRRGRGWAPLERVSIDQLQPGDRVLMRNSTHEAMTYRCTDPDGRGVFEDDDGRTHLHARSTTSRGAALTARFWRADQRAAIASDERAAAPERVNLDELQPGEQVQVHRTDPPLTYQGIHAGTGAHLLSDAQGDLVRYPAAVRLWRADDRALQAPAHDGTIELDV